MNNIWAFAPMQASNDLLGDSEGLRARLNADGYLYLSDVVPRRQLSSVYDDVLGVLERHGWIAPGLGRRFAMSQILPLRENDDRYLAVYDDVQRLESFHTLAHDETLLAVMRSVVGATAFPHPLKVARLVFPRHYEATTPPHQDFPNNQGTANLVAAWIPLHDCDQDLGGLAVLRGSQQFGVQPMRAHLGPGNREAIVSPELLDKCQWVTTTFAVGDVLLFGSMSVHASMHNASDVRMRISVDYRYQREGEPASDAVFHPHFGRLTWDDVFAGWTDTSLQYYWRDLDVDVVPFEPDRYGATRATKAEVRRYARYPHRLRARHAPPGADISAVGKRQ